MAVTQALRLHVVPIRYSGSAPVLPADDPVDTYAAEGGYDAFAGAVTTTEPIFPEAERTNDPTTDLGILGAEIADAVAEGLKDGRATLVVGGNCGIVPGVFGGIQEAYGPTVRVGLLWLDAHGDFNTPRTTLSGMLGGMPVAVSAGLAWPNWRESSKQIVPVPTDRIVMVDVRNLDEAEEQLIRATDVVIAAPAPGFPGEDLQKAVDELAAKCDVLYLHIDSDILDESLTPNHRTKEPNGPDMAQVLAAVDAIMATGKVAVYAVVSVWASGEGGDVMLRSGTELVRGGLEIWRQHGSAALLGS